MRNKPIWRRYLRFFGPDIPADVEDELRFHLESKIDELMRGGISESQARREALRQFGQIDEYRRICEQWAHHKEKTMERHDYWQGIGNDLRYAARTLRKDWGFTLIAVAILALGIGATTGVFSVIHALLLRPLPFREPERLVWIENKTDGRGQENLSALTNRALTVKHWIDNNRSFEGMAGYMAFFGYLGYNLTGLGSEPERLSGVPITTSFFEVLGVRPAMGRTFTPKDFPESERSIINAAAPRVAILSHGLWQRRFGGDPSIIGRKLTLNNGVTEIIGVMPASFDFTAVFTPGAQVDFYLPFPLSATGDRWGNTLSVVGRLKPGVSRETAQSEIDALSAAYRAEHPDIFGQEGRVQGLREHISGGVRRSLLVLAGAVALVLLIVCANLSNLLLARAAARRREMAVRAALGAGRWRIVRQLLVESLMLSLSGALLGLPLAYMATQLATRIDNSRVPLLNQVAIDPWALAVAIMVSLTTAILFGLAPGLTLARTDLHDTLKDSPRGATGSRLQLWTRHALVVSEVTLATMLLIGAGLLVQSFLKLMSTDPGFRPERTAIVRLDLGPDYNDPVRITNYLQAIRQNLVGRSGVTDAGFTDALPLDRQRTWNLRAQGIAYGRTNPAPLGFVSIISPGYLEAMGIPILAGRAFNDRDTSDREPVILVSTTLAKRLWPNQDPLGKLVDTAPPRRVVGIVGSVRQSSLDQQPGYEFYLPLQQYPMGSLDLVVRTSQDATSALALMRNAVRTVNPNQTIGKFRTMEDLVARAVSPRRFLLWLLAAFAGIALFLAALGIYGVIAYGVAQRRQEIGIRMALGASATTVQGAVLKQSLGLMAAGWILGGLGALALSRLLASLLYETQPTDINTFLLVGFVLLLVTSVASYAPARRAARIDPAITLRA